MITILIRTNGLRKDKFLRCLESIRQQTFKDYRVVVCYDNPCDYIPADIESFQVIPDKNHSYYWNLYCNELKARVNEGWFFFLDDDDVFYDETSLKRASKYLVGNQSIICQFIRERIRPDGSHFKNKIIRRGEIGMPCFFIHHSAKSLVDFDGKKAADYRYIKALSEKIGFIWTAEVVVKTFKEGHGH